MIAVDSYLLLIKVDSRVAQSRGGIHSAALGA